MVWKPQIGDNLLQQPEERVHQAELPPVPKPPHLLAVAEGPCLLGSRAGLAALPVSRKGQLPDT